MYALVEIKGRQYKVEKGIHPEGQQHRSGSRNYSVEFDNVLMLNDGKKVTLGQPYVKGAKVSATVSDHGREKKVVVLKYKKRKNYTRTQGHRQGFTVIKIDDILSK
jgi:large subunit ribosomal protein L21